MTFVAVCLVLIATALGALGGLVVADHGTVSSSAVTIGNSDCARRITERRVYTPLLELGAAAANMDRATAAAVLAQVNRDQRRHGTLTDQIAKECRD